MRGRLSVSSQVYPAKEAQSVPKQDAATEAMARTGLREDHRLGAACEIPSPNSSGQAPPAPEERFRRDDSSASRAFPKQEIPDWEMGLATVRARLRGLIREKLFASPMMQKMYADLVIASAPKSEEARLLARNYQKIMNRITMPNLKSCTHIKVTGVRCESPALRGEQFCYFHQHAHRGVRRPPRSRLHPMALIESQESIQASLMEVINGLLRNTLDAKRAELILRALHIAVKNARNVKSDSAVYPKVREVPEYAEPALEPIASPAGRAKAPVPTRLVASASNRSTASVSTSPADDPENEPSMPEPELDIPYTAAIPLQPSREERAEREHQAKVKLERARLATIRAELERAGRTIANGDFSPTSQASSPQRLPQNPHAYQRSRDSNGGNTAVDPTKGKPPASVKAETKTAAAPKERKNAAQRASAG